MNMNRVYIILGILLCFVSGFMGCGQKSLPALDEFISFKMDRDQIPGMTVCMVKDDRVVWRNGYGWANIEQQMPMNDQSVFCVASIAKSVTAMAVLQLAERGQLDIDEPINHYIPFVVRNPHFPEAEITIKQVLLHTSGISNGPSLWRHFSNGDPAVSLASWANGYFTPGSEFYHPEGNFERWAPGENFQYSNGGYGLLAFLVEHVSGETFNQYCIEHIFKPLEMHRSSFLVSLLDSSEMATMYGYGDFEDMERDLARSREQAEAMSVAGKPYPLYHYSSPELGAGGLYTCAADLSHFLIAIMNGGSYRGKHVLSPQFLAGMFGPGVNRELLPPWFGDLGMGGYSMLLDNNRPVWGHTGANPGVSSLMMFNPEIRMGAIVLANRFVDIRDMITWTFAEGFNTLNTIPLSQLDKSWRDYSDSYLRDHHDRRQITISVLPDHVPNESSVYVIGNHRYLGDWISHGIPLEKQADGKWEETFVFYDSTELVFNITRGSWNNKAMDSEGNELPAMVYRVSQDTCLTIQVAQWQDDIL